LPAQNSFQFEYMTWDERKGYSNWTPLVEPAPNQDAATLIKVYEVYKTFIPGFGKPEEWASFADSILSFLNSSRIEDFNTKKMSEHDYSIAVPLASIVNHGAVDLFSLPYIVGLRVNFGTQSKNIPDFFFDYTVGQRWVGGTGKIRRAVEYVDGQQPGFAKSAKGVIQYADEFRNLTVTTVDRTNPVAVSSSGTASIGVPPANFVERFLGVNTKLFIDNVTTLIKDTIFGSSKDVAEPASDAYHIGPDKTVFDPANPAKVTIAYDPARVPAGQSRNLAVFTSESPEGPWKTLENIVVDESKNTVSGTANDLSYFFAGVQRIQPKYAAWDVNKDGTVNIVDLVMVARLFGTSGANLPEDVNSNGVVDIVDLVTVATRFGQSSLLAAPQLDQMKMTQEQKNRAYNGSVELRHAGYEIVAEYLDSVIDGIELVKVSKSQLLANYPNPFNPETWIPYQIAEKGNVSVGIYTPDGRRVRQMELGERDAGSYVTRDMAAYWNGRNEEGVPVASGVYYLQLIVESPIGKPIVTSTRKVVVGR